MVGAEPGVGDERAVAHACLLTLAGRVVPHCLPRVADAARGRVGDDAEDREHHEGGVGHGDELALRVPEVDGEAEERGHRLGEQQGRRDDREPELLVLDAYLPVDSLACSYDEFSVDTRMNRILKATCVLLLRFNIKKERKKELKRLLPYFDDVSDTDLATVDWHIRFDRNNQTYCMLMNVCWLVAKGLLQSQADGMTRLADFLDEQRMSRLYEKFILEYYKRHHKSLSAEASHIKWKLDDDLDDMLLEIKSDITLSRGGNVLIIDAKYYGRTMQQQFDKRAVHSNNLYRIFTYVHLCEEQGGRA